MPGNCAFDNASPYQVTHNPEPYFTDIDDRTGSPYDCAGTDQTIPRASPGTPAAWPDPLPDFTYMSPDYCDDMHGSVPTGECPRNTDAIIAAGDAWLSTNVPALLAEGAIVIVTFDEGAEDDDTGRGGHVPTIMVGPGVSAGSDRCHPLRPRRPAGRSGGLLRAHAAAGRRDDRHAAPDPTADAVRRPDHLRLVAGGRRRGRHRHDRRRRPHERLRGELRRRRGPVLGGLGFLDHGHRAVRRADGRGHGEHDGWDRDQSRHVHRRSVVIAVAGARAARGGERHPGHEGERHPRAADGRGRPVRSPPSAGREPRR